MEIPSKVPLLDKTLYGPTKAKPVVPPAAPAPAKGDRVTLTAQAREVQAAREAIAKMDDVDHDKVARIKARIKAGTYKVDAAKTAEKMVDESLIKDLE
jgi:flagellar biosynthesis anti-sigma factor FlgM